MVMDMHRSRYHDDFIQLRCLGKGGFGKVYEVRNKLDGRRYAVKQIRIKGEITAEKTLREIKTLANLDHPNIVRYYSSWIEVTKIRRKGSSQKSSFGNHRLAHSTSPLAAMYGMPFGAHAAMSGGLDRSATPDSQRRHQELTVSSNESESDSELASGTHMQPLRNPFGRRRGSVLPAANGRAVGLNTASEPVTAYCNQRHGLFWRQVLHWRGGSDA
ncbi:kinase-like protein [Linderina pennispora]|uniref:Kinase-like protein n=1 Tax=Linderina pennispora TaxID=61395 RepID=A0A1Y1VYW1_9FUNG|nr:kinase-like protein [Linderina pennispora]ORX66451.1 kinase-like protein [Linderina pennispora]